jgi:hypothetical protein
MRQILDEFLKLTGYHDREHAIRARCGAVTPATGVKAASAGALRR